MLASSASKAHRLSSRLRSAARISVADGFGGRPRVAASPSFTHSSSPLRHCLDLGRTHRSSGPEPGPDELCNQLLELLLLPRGLDLDLDH